MMRLLNYRIHIPVIIMMGMISGCQSKEEQLEQALKKSTAWLWHQQGNDGAWHSTTHDVFEDGKALTPYILYHLLLIPGDKFNRPEDGVERGVEFIQRAIRSSFVSDSTAHGHFDYPNYSLSYALRVLHLLGRDTVMQKRISAHLLREQFTEQRGFTPDHLAYGGWGYGEPGLPPGQHGHVDVSHTRRIVEALASYSSSNCLSASLRETKTVNGGTAERRKAEAKVEEPLTLSLSYSLTRSRFFLQGVQRTPEDHRLYEGCLSRKDLPYDGGFISSTVTMYTNKSVAQDISGAGLHYPSYATATCDGLLAMHALGLQDTKAYRDARDWLAQHQDMTTIEGLSPDDPEQWHRVMHYYHFAVRAEAMTKAGIEGPWRDQLIRLLIKEQLYNGNYMNPLGGANKEDDPLLATMFAVIAMTYLKG